MARTAVKMISRTPEKFIPPTHKEDADLDEANADISKRPLVFMVRKMSRDEQFKMRDILEFKDDLDMTKGVKNSGELAKFIWETNVIEVRNVVVHEADGVKTYPVLSGKAKDDLWETQGMELEMNEAIIFARNISTMDDVEAKN